MIRFEHVTKTFPRTPRPALSDVSFEVQREEFVFLVGASGSGKSSCLRLILREDVASSGSIMIMGYDVRRLSSRKVPYFRRNIGTVFQDFLLLPDKTVFQNVAFSLQAIGKSRAAVRRAVPEALALVGLEGKERRRPHELSGGEQQRVAIARAIVNKPPILLADEPTGNLDPATSNDIMLLLRRINASGTTVVMATHESRLVDEMQKRVIELRDGVIVRDEAQGGYGDTSSLPSLAPSTTRAVTEAAATSMRELQRRLVDADGARDAGRDAAPDPAASEAVPPASAPRPIRIAAPDVDLDDLGVGEIDVRKLGLGGGDDTVGPTS